MHASDRYLAEGTIEDLRTRGRRRPRLRQTPAPRRDRQGPERLRRHLHRAEARRLRRLDQHRGRRGRHGPARAQRGVRPEEDRAILACLTLRPIGWRHRADLTQRSGSSQDYLENHGFLLLCLFAALRLIPKHSEIHLSATSFPIPAMSPLRLLLAFFTFHLSLLTSPAADFPAPTNNQEITHIPFTPPQDTVKLMHLPPGFKATLFAAEPDVQNPIAMCWDEKGRLWIAENYTYADAKERFDMKSARPHPHLRGHGQRRPLRQAHRLCGRRPDAHQHRARLRRRLCPVPAAPALHSRPRTTNPTVRRRFCSTASAPPPPAATPSPTASNGAPTAGSTAASASAARAGSTSPAPRKKRRKPTAGGIWRYHPTRKIFEPYCHGTTNPWGIDWDENGEMFFINTVIGHLWHGIPGAHFKRMHGEDPYAHIYDLIDQHADHYHWDTGEAGATSARSASPIRRPTRAAATPTSA